MRSVVYADKFVEDVAAIWSERVLAELDRRLAALEAFPELGSSDVRPSLTARFGPGLRKFPVATFVIVYRYVKDKDRLEFLALPYGADVR